MSATEPFGYPEIGHEGAATLAAADAPILRDIPDTYNRAQE